MGHLFRLLENQSLIAVKCSDLQPAVQRPLDGDALAGVDTVSGDGGYERIQLILLLFQFLYQTLDGTLGKALILSTLPVAHQAVNDAQTCITATGRVHRHACALRRIEEERRNMQ